MKRIIILLNLIPIIGFGQCISGDCNNRNGKYKYDNGSYEGSFKDGFRDGQGTYTFNLDDNSDLVGLAQGDSKTGIWEKGKLYKGTYKYGQNYIGFGFQTNIIDSLHIVTSVYENSPAENIGININDVILKIDNISYQEWINNKTKRKINSKHSILLKSGKELKNFEIKRALVNKNLDPSSYNKYVGNFDQTGNFSGYGVMYYHSGDKETGIWKSSKLIESYAIEDQIKIIVEKSVNEWQKKGEFEKTLTHSQRVNEQTRKIKVKELQKTALKDLKDKFIKSSNFKNLSLGEYDADNETFLLKSNTNIFDRYQIRDIVLPVPINQAKDFKKDFKYYDSHNEECVVIDGQFVISYIEFKLNQYNQPVKLYTYNLSNAKDYTITEIDYEFSEIEIEKVNSDFVSNSRKENNISTKKIKIGTSSVNINIPNNKKVKHRYALVIGNEDYQSKQQGLNDEQNVDYAINDASIFKEYALKTLGVKEENMYFLENATSIEMNRTINLVTKIIKKLGDKAELIVYYAGHGYPDEITKIPYLIPVDVPASDMYYAISLNDLYKKLSSTNAKSIAIFLDACFTGGGRNSGLLASRGVKVKAKEGILAGNMIVFSASSKEQSALPFHEQGHGMFTYYLLKKLQESNGKTSMGELSDYIKENVSIQSLKINEKEQDPAIQTSQNIINNWRKWKF
tara:strand:- start:344 stop:2389 length:2046 start_codon:yes stop_codon:yes gene_type:complete